MIPTFIIRVWLLGLASVGILVGAAYCGWEWYDRSCTFDPPQQRRVFQPQFGANEATYFLGGALLLGAWTFAGSLGMRGALRLSESRGRSSTTGQDDPPEVSPQPAAVQRLTRPDGTELHVELYGPENGTPIVLSHGWGLNSTEWNYFKRELADRFRLIVWDEPGLGQSTRPIDRNFSLDKMARDLKAVLTLAGGRSAILLGHSIGGMMVLTFCRLFPGTLGKEVAGLVLTNTTYTNPVRTTKGAGFYTAIEKPVLVPLMYLTIVLSPLLWVASWLSYLNGSAHLSAKRSSFAGTETWEQLDFAARFQVKASPAVLARGMLGMMRYDATPVLSAINTPVLIVSGDRDTVTKPEASEKMRETIPKAYLVSLSPAKHLGLIEHHRRYGESVRDFCSALGGELLKQVA